jgi:3-dehydroquinate synthase
MPATLNVILGERSYPILFAGDMTAAIRAKIGELLAAGRKMAVLTDHNLAVVQAPALDAMFGAVPRHVVPAGEETKSLTELGGVLDFLASHRIDRRGVLFVVGGGVIGDLGGFAAASWLRGIEFYQVPTTLLAMVDSSVGGKTGINLKAGKNLVGAFYQPCGVYISASWLKTLPPREFAAGMIKYGLLGDAALFAQLEKQRLAVESSALPGVIRRCCEIKAEIVAADERELAEQGGRALLNLGHTFGHAIEQVAGYGAYLHGEAVAIGLCAAARLSEKLRFLEGADVKRVEAVVEAYALPTRLRTPLPLAALAEAMARDKKVRSGSLRFVVLKKIGEAATQHDVAPALAEAAFREVGAA